MNIKKLFGPQFEQVENEALRTIQAGGIVIAPFDTVYGFICDPYNDTALEKIFKLKNRELNKTIGLALNPAHIIHSLAEVKHFEFTKGKVPGPYTFILPLKDKNISKYCQNKGTVAIRIPNSELILMLSKKFGKPLAQTSANKSGKSTCASIDEIKKQFTEAELDSVDLIIDCGLIQNSKESVIYDLTGDSPREIAR